MRNCLEHINWKNKDSGYISVNNRSTLLGNISKSFLCLLPGVWNMEKWFPYLLNFSLFSVSYSQNGIVLKYIGF